MPPKPTARKRPQEDVDDAPPAKRRRGRPPKDPNAPPAPPKDPNAPKRGRGRPPKDPNAPPPPPKDPNAPARGRGRPPKDPNAASTPAKATATATRGRGRPPKTSDATSAAPATAGRGRGRPKKDAATSAPTIPKTTASRGRGRPKKAPETMGRTPKNTGVKLTDLIGTYEISCEEVEGNWPDVVEDMHISIAALPNTRSVLIASFDLGIIEGTMVLAADEDTLGRVRAQMDRDGVNKGDKAIGPMVEERTVYFAWRGRSTGDENEVHHGKYGGQAGSLTFKDNACSSFEGVGSFPMLGKECAFTGTRVSDEADEDVEAWDNFDEEAYEEANRRRWG